jgi:hypothetical protein
VADQPGNNEQFEQVLSRLDALMKRSQAGDVTVPPVPETAPSPYATMPEETASEPMSSSEESSTPFVILEETVEVPVLTEIYEGPSPASQSGKGEELADAVIDALMPLMLENLDIIVAEEAARMQQNIAERLRVEIADALRQRLQAKP